MSDGHPAGTGDDARSGKWWVIHEGTILDALRAVAEGADPDLVMLELEANTEPGEVDDEST